MIRRLNIYCQQGLIQSLWMDQRRDEVKKYLHNNKMTLAFGLVEVIMSIKYCSSYVSRLNICYLDKYLFVLVLECYYVVAVALIICFISAATQTYDILIAGTQGSCSDKARIQFIINGPV